MQPENPQPPRHGEVAGLALVSLVLGVTSIPLTLCYLVLGIPLGLAAIVTGLFGRRAGGTGRSLALAGVVAGAVGVALAGVLVALSDI